MKDESLAVVFEVIFDRVEKWGGEVAIFGEVVMRFEVDDLDFGFDGGFFGFFG